jgi:hypothetical protein
LRPHTVLKGILRADPCLDVLLGRIPHCFLPPANGTAEDAVAGLAAGLRRRDALVIFPEGGNFTPGRHHRAVARLLRLVQYRRAVRAARGAVGVSRVADVTGLDVVGIPVVNTMRPSAEPGNLTVTCGKGTTLLAATASALMEATERHCGEQHGREGITGCFAELRTRRPTLHPRHPILSRHSSWTADTPMEWWPARELSIGQEVLVPAAAVFTPGSKVTGIRTSAGRSARRPCPVPVERRPPSEPPVPSDAARPMPPTQRRCAGPGRSGQPGQQAVRRRRGGSSAWRTARGCLPLTRC